MTPAQELRIGNWVEVKGHDSEWYQQPVAFTHIMTLVKFPDKEIRGIPLTPEVLEACGFELRTEEGAEIDYKLYPLYIKFQHNGCLLITILEYSSCSHIKYLHQLQNLFFCLCGEELIYKPK